MAVASGLVVPGPWGRQAPRGPPWLRPLREQSWCPWLPKRLEATTAFMAACCKGTAARAVISMRFSPSMPLQPPGRAEGTLVPAPSATPQPFALGKAFPSSCCLHGQPSHCSAGMQLHKELLHHPSPPSPSQPPKLPCVAEHLSAQGKGSLKPSNSGSGWPQPRAQGDEDTSCPRSFAGLFHLTFSFRLALNSCSFFCVLSM